MKENIIALFSKKENVSYTFNQIKKLISIDKLELTKILEELELEGIILKNKDDEYMKFPKGYVIGNIFESKTGNYGLFINDIRYSIPKNNLHSALDGDLVVAQKKDSFYNVYKILKRNTKKIVCEVVEVSGKKRIKSCLIGQDFFIDIGKMAMKDRIIGERILVDIENNLDENIYSGNYIATIGFKNDPNIDLQCIAIAHGFNPKFNPETVNEARIIPKRVYKKDLAGRLDLRNDLIFTIDGAHTKDIDDAISIKKLDNGHTELGVHIAHVSYYVHNNSEIYKEAKERGNSLYMLDSVIPMLPQILSNGICSLNPNVVRLTRSVLMEYDENGNMVNYRIVKSVIKSKKKMTYDDVNKILEENIIPKGYENFAYALKQMHELSQLIGKRRANEGFINFASQEAEVLFNTEGKVDNIDVKSSRSAEDLIENFMIEANSTVAQDTYWKGLPFIYRNHAIPYDARLNEALSILKTIGYHFTKLKDISDQSTIQIILNKLSKSEEYPIISTFILKAMQRAKYDITNNGHYGLGLGYYTHYTSPIRRLSDLKIHQLLDSYDIDCGISMDENLVKSELVEVCQNANMQERNADMAEYQAYKLASVEYMQNYVGEKFEVFICDISSYKIKIKTTNGIDGIIDLLKFGINFDYNSDSRSIKLLDSDQTLLIGQKINVELQEASKENLELYFVPTLIKDKIKKRTIN